MIVKSGSYYILVHLCTFKTQFITMIDTGYCFCTSKRLTKFEIENRLIFYYFTYSYLRKTQDNENYKRYEQL